MPPTSAIATLSARVSTSLYIYPCSGQSRTLGPQRAETSPRPPRPREPPPRSCPAALLLLLLLPPPLAPLLQLLVLAPAVHAPQASLA